MFDWQTLVSGLGSIIENSQKIRAGSRAQQDLLAGQRAGYKQQQVADKMIGNQVADLRTSAPTVPQQASLADFTTALHAVRAAPGASLAPNVGGERYQAGVGNAQQQVAKYGAGQALDLSQLEGATRQREMEGNARASLASNLKTVAGRGDMELYLAKLRAAREQPNPWVTMLAQIGQRIGRNYVPKSQRLGAYQTTPDAAEWSDLLPQGGGGLGGVEVA